MEAEAVSSGDGPLTDEHSVRGDPDHIGLAAQIAAIENERKHLARSLNDGPSQTLSNIVLRAENVERLVSSDHRGAADEAQRLRGAAIAALADVRRFMFEAYPSVLDDLGLIQTLRRYLQIRGGRERLSIELRIVGDERRLAHPTELALFRAVQGFIASAEQQPRLRNAVLTVAFHSHATEVTFGAAGVQLDPGGLSVEAASDSLDLAGLRARLAAVGGDLTHDDTPGASVTLTARIPS